MMIIQSKATKVFLKIDQNLFDLIRIELPRKKAMKMDSKIPVDLVIAAIANKKQARRMEEVLEFFCCPGIIQFCAIRCVNGPLA